MARTPSSTQRKPNVAFVATRSSIRASIALSLADNPLYQVDNSFSDAGIRRPGGAAMYPISDDTAESRTGRPQQRQQHPSLLESSREEALVQVNQLLKRAVRRIRIVPEVPDAMREENHPRPVVSTDEA